VKHQNGCVLFSDYNATILPIFASKNRKNLFYSFGVFVQLPEVTKFMENLKAVGGNTPRNNKRLPKGKKSESGKALQNGFSSNVWTMSSICGK
jgi:hypothetical protein